MNLSRPVFIVSAKRTPIGKYLGAFKDVPAVELGKAAVRAALADAKASADKVDVCVVGHARQAGCGPNPARQVSIGAGLPHEVPAYTVNQACASGLRAIALAAQEIELGRAHVAVAGGMESMTRVPYLIEDARVPRRLGHGTLVDAMYRDGFLCPLCGQWMGRTAETLAEKYGIPRGEQDAYAVETQQRCERARKRGAFRDEIVPFDVPAKGGATRIEADEHPRDGVTASAMAKLEPVFKEGGTVHPGNASGITDGAAALVVASEEGVKRLGVPPLARIEAHVTVGVDPAIMGIGPVPATRRLLEATGGPIDRFDRIELNEAFAAQVLACDRELKLPRERLNVLGGAIALGHPIGCTGARVVVTLLHEMRREKLRRGLATLCVSGGLGIAMSFERV